MKSATILTMILLLPALALGPVGCETMGEHKAAVGAAIGTAGGAAIGAVIGHQSGHKGEGALIGAAAGAALGAGAGYWLDRRAMKLKTLQDQNTAVQSVPASQAPAPVAPGDQQGEAQPAPQPTVPEHITLRLNDSMLFGQGSSAISAEGAAKLDQVAALLAENPRERIVIRGYTSSEGTDPANVDLSKCRAEMVANYLVGKGLNPGRVTAVGMGASNPIASNETEIGRAQNRRVEIEVFPPEESAASGY